MSEAKPASSAVSLKSHEVERTSAGRPYILLRSSSPTPVYLTEFYATDAAATQATLSLLSLQRDLVAVPVPYTLADAEWWINLQLTGSSNLPLQVLRAGDPETGRLIGCVSLMPAHSEALLAVKDRINLPKKEMGENECELGYYLHPDWRGKGIVGNAVRALIWWGKEHMGAENVVVKVAEGNVASRGVIEKLKEFLRVEEEDSWVDWPESKGGGRRKLLVWKWTR